MVGSPSLFDLNLVYSMEVAWTWPGVSVSDVWGLKFDNQISMLRQHPACSALLRNGWARVVLDRVAHISTLFTVLDL